MEQYACIGAETPVVVLARTVDAGEWLLVKQHTETINTSKPMSELKLHEAIEMVIKEAGRPLTFTEIAKQINARNLYSRQDRTPVPASQISARVKNYPSWFTVNRDETPATVSNAK